MDIIACNFLRMHDEYNAEKIVNYARNNNLNSIGILLAKFLESRFPHSVSIKNDYGIMLHYLDKHRESYQVYKRLLSFKHLDYEYSKTAIVNRHYCIDNIQDDFTYYNYETVSKILNNKRNNFPLVTVTITSCKRLNLFIQTINSFMNCCTDIHLIDKWICIDDNSAENDREKMREMYPFITFYFKSQEEKGHPKSMNMIFDLVSTPYIFHLEDDWKFFEQRNYISECMEVIGTDTKIGQCLINKNYAETSNDYDINGGIQSITQTGLRYYIHEFCNDEESIEKFVEKYGPCKHCAYWPHFSFRPSLIRMCVLKEIGSFSETAPHFEMEYSFRYSNLGYKSAFLETVYCLHTGRLTSERFSNNKPNAYELNNEIQFYEKEKETFPDNLKTFVINLDRRSDRWEKFIENSKQISLKYERFSAIDGTKLAPTLQLQQIFEHNDYNMRQGIVGCALSHIKLYIQLLCDEESEMYCILEDDITFVPEFDKKLLMCLTNLEKVDWDIFYLGHHLWKQFIDEEVHSPTMYPKIEKFNRFESLNRSMGGTGGYIITKSGAEKLLNFINQTGMVNGIDTMQQKSADDLSVFYSYPHLIYSECFRGDNKTDTDIQNNFNSLSIPFEQRFLEELKQYYHIVKIEILESIPNMISMCMYYFDNDKEKIIKLSEECKQNANILYYTIDDRVIFMSPKDNGRYFHRFKKNGNWNIDEAIKYK